MLPIESRDQLAAVYVAGGEQRKLHVGEEGVACLLGQLHTLNRIHGAAYDMVDFDFDLDFLARDEELRLDAFLVLRNSCAEVAGVEPIPRRTNCFVDGGERSCSRHLVIGEGQVQVDGEPRHIAQKEIDRGTTL